MEHLAGKGVDKVLRLINARRFKTWNTGAAPLIIKDQLKRFTLLAAAITGTQMRVVDLKGDTNPRPYLSVLHKTAHPALLIDHAFAWCDSETIFLPVSLVTMQTEYEQERLAKLIIFFLSAQRLHGTLKVAFQNRPLLTANNLIADLFWIIENSRLTKILFKEYPGLFKEWESIVTHLLRQRPKQSQIRTSEVRVEGFLKEVLLNGNCSITTSTPGSADESLVLAKSIKEKWGEEGLNTKRYRAIIPFAPWGRLLPDRLTHGSGSGAEEPADQETDKKGSQETSTEEEQNEEVEKDGSERSRYLTKTEEVDEEANEQGLLLNIYDKLISWSEFVNVTRPFDDEAEEEQDNKADEMTELTTAELKRTTSTLFDADLEKEERRNESSGIEEEPTEESFIYPEWDYRKKSYREKYSKVTESTAEEISNNFIEGVLEARRGLIKEVRRKFEMLNPETRKTTRQTDGEEIDIDAAVEAAADMAAGRQPDERLYTSQHRTERDLSVLFLIDLSMSTETWVTDRKVIDHEKEAVIVLCEAMERLMDKYAVYGFSGKSRKGCRFYRIKTFQEKYKSTKIKNRINGLIPHHYTRMGPAIRHASQVLLEERSKMKLLFIISDGKPNDIDEYEGMYGIEDSRMAIKEAEGAGIVPFCLTVDHSARDYLQRIFSKKNHAVLPHVERLAKKLPELYARLVKNL